MSLDGLCHTFHRTNGLSRRLSALSRERFYDVYQSFEWPDSLDSDRFAMSPEITTLAGTEVWSSLRDEQIRALTLYETATLFSNTLNGERLLVAGLASQLYGRDVTPEITDYLHHFLDEENKHMIMFGVFCETYAGRVYPEKKLALAAGPQAAGESLIRFYAMAMVVEAFGDYYNVRTMGDDRCDPLPRALSRVHHLDEARHLAFDRAYLTELAAQHLPQWPEETLAAFRKWLAGFMRMNWVTYYNPAAYRDAGIEDPYEAQRLALAAPAQKALREEISRPTVRFFLKIGLLDAEPEL